MLISLLLCFVGFVLLYLSAGWLVKGSSSLARNIGLTPIVIGLTVVAFGTSAPELVVSLISSIEGKGMIALGNVIGSNICNIGLVMGLSAVFQPIVCSNEVVKRDMPVMMGISIVLLFLSYNSIIGRVEGAVLFGGVVAYTIINYRIAIKKTERKEGRAVTNYEKELDEIGYIDSRSKQILLIIIGITGVAGGAHVVVESAVNIMTTLGVNEKFISLTLVAFGTSLPELTTSLVAAIKKEMDISIGNLIGSNVFNILSVLGASSLVRPIIVPGGFFESGLITDYLVMILIGFLPWFMMRKDNTMGRANGFTLLMCYTGYIIYLIIKS